MTTEERLSRIEAHLFGNPEQPQEQPKPKFGSFYVDCTRDEYPEVKAILEAQGYRLFGSEWLRGEHCVSVEDSGEYFTYELEEGDAVKPTLTLAQLREKYGVQPLPPLPDEVKKDLSVQNEPVFQKVSDTLREKMDLKPKKYEAGFWWNNVTNLNLPDGSYLYLGIVSGVWQKSARRYPRSARPHTLKPVEQHTVGMFYAIRGVEGEHLNDYRNYALCVGEGEFVGAYPYSPNVVTIHGYGASNISLLEVTPA